jgi:hypothetical protein
MYSPRVTKLFLSPNSLKPSACAISPLTINAIDTLSSLLIVRMNMKVARLRIQGVAGQHIHDLQTLIVDTTNEVKWQLHVRTQLLKRICTPITMQLHKQLQQRMVRRQLVKDENDILMARSLTRRDQSADEDVVYSSFERRCGNEVATNYCLEQDVLGEASGDLARIQPVDEDVEEVHISGAAAELELDSVEKGTLEVGGCRSDEVLVHAILRGWADFDGDDVALSGGAEGWQVCSGGHYGWMNLL